MTRYLLAIGILMTSLLLSQGTLAGDKTGEEYNRIPVSLASKVRNPEALETFYGDVIDVKEVKNLDSSNVRRLLKAHQIELKDGEIFYPEEIQYLLVGKKGSNQKAPHTPD